MPWPLGMEECVGVPKGSPAAAVSGSVNADTTGHLSTFAVPFPVRENALYG